MSNSFWKFNQDSLVESSVTSILNNAFIKIENKNNNNIEDNNSHNEDDADTKLNKVNRRHHRSTSSITSSSTSQAEDIENATEDDDDDDDDTLPINEEDYLKYYKPNLDILNSLLDDDELYTELMCSNFKLLIYLKYPAVLERLIDLLTNEFFLTDDDNDKEEREEEHEEEQETTHLKNEINHDQNKQTITVSDTTSEASEETSVTLPPESQEQIETRRAKMAAEILSADIWPLSSTLIENKSLLLKLWSILKFDQISIQASNYFIKINERLLDMDLKNMLDFVIDQFENNNLIQEFLMHINNSSIMDFLLKILSTDKPDYSTGIIRILKKQNLISSLIDRLDSKKFDVATQTSSTDLIKAIITLSANTNNTNNINTEITLSIGPNELTREIVTAEVMEKLIKIMLQGGTSLSNGVGIIIEIIRKNNSDYDFIQVMYTTLETHPPNDRDPIHLIHLIKCFSKYIDNFKDILAKDCSTEKLMIPIGEIEPLGFERFKVCELIAELLHCSNMTLLNEMNGEATINERDLERIKSLKDKDDTADISEQFNSLSLKAANADENEENDKKDLVQEHDESNRNKVQNDLKIEDEEELVVSIGREGEEHDDKVELEEFSEEQLRSMKLPGDLLKIALKDSGIVNVIVDMFFKFEWNNFLHNVVFDIIQQIFNGPLKQGFNKFLISDLLVNCKLTHKIIQGDKKCLDDEKKTGIRCGYMGHLTLIAEEVAKFQEYIDEMDVNFKDPNIRLALNDENWQHYMNSTLAENRNNFNTVLGDFVLDDEEQDTGNDSNSFEDDFINDEANHNNNSEEYENDDSNIHDLYYDSQNNINSDNANEEDENYAEYTDLDNMDYFEYIDATGHKTTLRLNNSNDENISNKSNVDSNLGSNSEVYQHQFEFPTNNTVFEDDDDDYMDPNDDGQSYAKPNNPLYNDILLQSKSLPSSTSDIDEGEEDAFTGSDIPLNRSSSNENVALI
ncbi:hypothetical protein KAFR_0A03490 [Kazachstania africana CBS 2517]|uniref:SIT4 phosphatase-associated protein n=1 Tax=Kazachstania africana (strain ATCC 22294 / BCRC 22015 / CBS 2517 / CECT 1963 / NBRC 1671 / NRRL Y-8276) TaxID=1071382 RepID=H2AN34_KAZAF|nr:hypothetical protein KAFR_0A03490 [Kazachstania africana CBS 2517]CCF55784.1 hypothetical protein KAFR_0A03490 [Kazachstania africana CBS 2517]